MPARYNLFPRKEPARDILGILRSEISAKISERGFFLREDISWTGGWGLSGRALLIGTANPLASASCPSLKPNSLGEIVLILETWDSSEASPDASSSTVSSTSVFSIEGSFSSGSPSGSSSLFLVFRKPVAGPPAAPLPTGTLGFRNPLGELLLLEYEEKLDQLYPNLFRGDYFLYFGCLLLCGYRQELLLGIDQL